MIKVQLKNTMRQKSKLVTPTEDNQKCVHLVSEHFLDITAPKYAEVSISHEGVVHVNINGICVLRVCRAGTLSWDVPPKEID